MSELPNERKLSNPAFVNILAECFCYSEGKLFWKERPASHFSTRRGMSIFNKRFSGTEVGWIYKNRRGREHYLHTYVFGKGFIVHRIIFALFNGVLSDSLDIDHIDGNGMNNKIENLRAVDQRENKKNLPLSKASKTGITGVTWCKRQKQYTATIKDNGKQKFLGYFDDIEKAAIARKKAETALGYHENHGRSKNG